MLQFPFVYRQLGDTLGASINNELVNLQIFSELVNLQIFSEFVNLKIFSEFVNLKIFNELVNFQIFSELVFPAIGLLGYPLSFPSLCKVWTCV